MKTLDLLLEKDLTGIPVLVRIDANVSFVDDGHIDELEGLRIDRALPTITALADAGAKVLLVGHMGRDGSESTRQVVTYLQETHDITSVYMDELTDQVARAESFSLGQPGSIVVLENIRAYPQETSNDPAFAQTLASYADYYVNEAFSVSHRSHTSVVGIPQYLPSFVGYNTANELSTLDDIRSHLATTLLVVGGAKFRTKLDLIRKGLEAGASVFVGGALAHTIYHARGRTIGRSRYDDVDVADIAEHPNLVVPEFVHVKNSDGTLCERHISEIEMGDTIVDMGEQSAEALGELIAAHSPSHILWNGPLGWYEEGFTDGTETVAAFLAQQEAPVVLGGGDTVYVLEKSGISLDAFHFVSTGGGALLDYIIDGHLVGIDAVEKSSDE